LLGEAEAWHGAASQSKGGEMKGFREQLNPEAVAAALAAPGMFDCTRFPLPARLSERQCLVNQERAQAGGYPSFCLNCPEGLAIKARHPEGAGVKLRPLAVDGSINKPLELKLAREAARQQAQKPAAPPSQAVSENEEKNMTENMTEAPPPETSPGAEKHQEAPRCLKHPEEPQKQAHNGRYLGRCQICMVEGANKAAEIRKANKAAGISRPVRPKSAARGIPDAPEAVLALDMSGHQEIMEQLRDRAADEVRTPEQQAIYYIKCGLKSSGGGQLEPLPAEPVADHTSAASACEVPREKGKRVLPAHLKDATPAVRREYGL
jgi:hypothetical protein